MAVASRFIDSRAERATGPQAPQEAIVPDAPPEVPEPKPTSLLRLLLPVVMVVAVIGMIALMVTAGATRNPLTFMFPLMMVMSMIGMVTSGNSPAKDMGPIRRDYQRHLAGIRRAVETSMREQNTHAEFHHPDPDDVWAIVGTHRMWERRPGDPDFGAIRIGRGAQRPAAGVGMPDVVAPEKLDPVSAISLRQVVRAGRVVPHVPVAVHVRSFPVIAVGGSVDSARGLVRAMVAQLAAFHHPNDFCVTTVSPGQHRRHAPLGRDSEGGREQWEWLKWLPHVVPWEESDRSSAEHRLVIVDVAAVNDAKDQLAELSRTMHTADSQSIATTIIMVTSGDADCEQWALAEGLLLECEGTPVDLYAVTGAGRERIAQADFLGPSAAEALARRMAGYAIPVGNQQETATGDPVLAELGIDPPATRIEYSEHVGKERLRIPIGTRDDGQVVYLDLKEAAEGGVGPHGLCIGATGSGKSEALKGIVTALAATHGPEQLNLVLVDFKGGATFLGLETLPHVAALITNLQDEIVLVDRMQDAIRGEMLRRQELLRAAGKFAGVAEYEEARRSGRTDLEPIPALVIVVDEFSELLGQRPEFADLFVAVGRLGRSLHMHLLLASQRLEEGRLRGLDSHLSYRIGLKTFSAAESRSILGVPDAYHLPAIPGTGYLKTSSSDPVRFRATYVSGPVTHRTSPLHNEQTELSALSRAESAVPMVRLFDMASVLEPSIEDRSQSLTAPGISLTSSGERTDNSTTLDAVVKALKHHPRTAHQIWLPPLPATIPFAAIADSTVDELVATVGIIDRPAEQKQDPYVVDLRSTGGHCAIVGAPRSGKTTAARTVVLGLALSTPSTRLQFHVIDFGAGGLADLRSLPHTASVAHRGDHEQLRRTIGHVAGEISRREALYRASGWHSVAAARASGMPDVVVLIDGWPAFRTEHMDLADTVQTIISEGLAVGIHVIVTAHRWTELRPAVRDLIGTRIELRQAEAIDSVVDRKAAKLVPEAPGRGIVKVANNSCGMLIAESIPMDTRAVIEACTSRGDVATAPLELLPTSLSMGELCSRYPDVSPCNRFNGAGSNRTMPTSFAIGLDEENLEPVLFDWETDRHLILLGSTGCGRTTTLQTVMDGILATSGDSKCVVLDYRRGLLESVAEDRLAGYAGSSAVATPMIEELAGVLKTRLPGPEVTPSQLKARDWWTGPRIAVVVDDYDLVVTSRSNPLLPLAELIPHASDIGLQLVLARRIGGATRALHDPVMGAAKDNGATAFVMDGTREDGPILGVTPRAQPPGRGSWVRHGAKPRVIQIATIDESPGKQK
ncbi:type VII secretion protein EccCa [Corynebacterium sp. H113]|uniref:type VII secretion protein EccCa n=1 Tax=Corynebacterium sp. H113 TaxID=3133419 RepID=UPI00309CBD0E